MLPLNWSCHKEDTKNWVARDKGWGDWGLKSAKAKIKETSIVSVLAGHWATMSRQKSLNVPWHRLCICGVAPEGCSPTFFHKKFHHLGVCWRWWWKQFQALASILKTLNWAERKSGSILFAQFPYLLKHVLLTVYFWTKTIFSMNTIGHFL